MNKFDKYVDECEYIISVIYSFVTIKSWFRQRCRIDGRERTLGLLRTALGYLEYREDFETCEEIYTFIKDECREDEEHNLTPIYYVYGDESQDMSYDEDDDPFNNY